MRNINSLKYFVKLIPNKEIYSHGSNFTFLAGKAYDGEIDFTENFCGAPCSVTVYSVRVDKTVRTYEELDKYSPFKFRFYYEHKGMIAKYWSVAKRRVLLEKSGFYI